MLPISVDDKSHHLKFDVVFQTQGKMNEKESSHKINQHRKKMPIVGGKNNFGTALTLQGSP